MGQAKNRGTFEQRKAEGIAREAAREERENERLRAWRAEREERQAAEGRAPTRPPGVASPRRIWRRSISMIALATALSASYMGSKDGR